MIHISQASAVVAGAVLALLLIEILIALFVRAIKRRDIVLPAFLNRFVRADEEAVLHEAAVEETAQPDGSGE